MFKDDKTLLNFIVKGMIANAQQMVKANFHTILQESSVEDGTGRHVVTSPIRYLIWARDAKMLKALLDTIGFLTDARAIKKAIYDHLTIRNIEKAEHFDLEVLENVLRELGAAVKSGDKSRIKTAWEKVGLEQAKLPDHFLFEMADKKSLFCERDFLELELDYQRHAFLQFASNLYVNDLTKLRAGLGKDYILEIYDKFIGMERSSPMLMASQARAEDHLLQALAWKRLRLARDAQIKELINDLTYSNNKTFIRM